MDDPCEGPPTTKDEMIAEIRRVFPRFRLGRTITVVQPLLFCGPFDVEFKVTVVADSPEEAYDRIAREVTRRLRSVS